ncbi:unnamed protein product [Cuscuta epithymum]|uniref:Uncharacterized protein n=1 Tax=Cuscuta epithymum TaxID=186058 RepID=A0AAV0EVW7_9ASTE|nr:unnamed protein product [Cuscuta epithymum]
MTLWSIWKARNQVVWKGEEFNPKQVVEAGASVMRGWREMQGVETQRPEAGGFRATATAVRWRRPVEGGIKLMWMWCWMKDKVKELGARWHGIVRVKLYKGEVQCVKQIGEYYRSGGSQRSSVVGKTDGLAKCGG